MPDCVQNKKLSYRWRLVILFSIFYFLFSSKARAAELYFGSHSKEVTVGQTFEVGVFLNTEQQSINAVEGRVSVTGALVVKEIRDGNSFINLWVERPHMTETGRVVFAGIIPGGYNGREAYLFSVILEAKKTGQAAVSSNSESVLLNDGEGTVATLRRSPLRLRVTDIGAAPEYKQEPDDTPPEAFAPELGQDAALFDGRWFVAFAAQDKQSGIDRYEVYESQHKYWPAEMDPERTAWESVTSPYELKDQELRSFVYVKAIDNAGNARIGVLPPQHPLPWYENIAVWSILLLGTLLTFVIRRVLWFLKSKHRKN